MTRDERDSEDSDGTLGGPQQNAGGNGRKSTSFMRQLVKILEARPDAIRFNDGTLIIPDPAVLERLLPEYYRTAKLSSFQRQLNNFGFHRVVDAPGMRSGPWRPNAGREDCMRYHQVHGDKKTSVAGLLDLRPLARRKKERARDDGDDDLDERRVVARPRAKRTRSSSDANAAMLLLSCASVPVAA
mmetsp:Transcript_12305/g.37919  ORF Transcript_12305/g.37919 Transcript_12305/m.37919 type:complete len:186 (+) Transcript_12305:306-863(+)